MQYKHAGKVVFGAVIALSASIFAGVTTFQDGVTINGPVTLTGSVTATSVVREIVLPLSASSTNQNLCSMVNPAGRDLILSGVAFTFTTSSYTATATNRFTISLANSASATGTGSNVLFDSFITFPNNASSTLASTSTLMLTQKSIWRPEQILNFRAASPTSTIAGSCYATFW